MIFAILSTIAIFAEVVTPAWTNHNRISGSQPMMSNFKDWAESISTEQVNSDWDATSGPAKILNKPTIPTEYLKRATTTADSITVVDQDNSTKTFSVNYEYELRSVNAPTIVVASSGEIVTAQNVNGTLNVVVPGEVLNESADFVLRVITTGISQIGSVATIDSTTVNIEWLCDPLTETGSVAANKTTYIYFFKCSANTYAVNATEVK